MMQKVLFFLFCLFFVQNIWAHPLPSLNTKNMQTMSPSKSCIISGPVLILDIPNTLANPQRKLHEGNVYLLGKYQGKENIENTTGLLLANTQDFVPMRDFSLLTQLDTKHTGAILLGKNDAMHMVLAHCDNLGSWIVHSLNALDINIISYNISKNEVRLFDPMYRLEYIGTLREMTT